MNPLINDKLRKSIFVLILIFSLFFHRFCVDRNVSLLYCDFFLANAIIRLSWKCNINVGKQIPLISCYMVGTAIHSHWLGPRGQKKIIIICVRVAPNRVSRHRMRGHIQRKTKNYLNPDIRRPWEMGRVQILMEDCLLGKCLCWIFHFQENSLCLFQQTWPSTSSSRSSGELKR